jgi:glycerol-3-phosphate acyltransferase PlsX
MKIGIDAMGGDFAPQAIVAGVVLAARELPKDAAIVLIGNEEIIASLLIANNYSEQNISIVHAEDIIDMDEHPVKALSKKPNSSIAIGFKLLKDKSIDIFCGAGNTGAMHVGALFSIKAIEGIMRPAIAGVLPQRDGSYATVIDIGANADCKPEQLEQFGLIGSIFVQHTFNIKKPRVALLNIGEEEQKGSLIAQAAHQLLKSNTRINFVGNIEGKDILSSKADVIVTDGFSGNIVFKMAESIYDLAVERGIDDEIMNRMNYESVGGSPILGVNGNVMIAHGVSSPTAIKNMIGWAYKQVNAAVYTQIAKALS